MFFLLIFYMGLPESEKIITFSWDGCPDNEEEELAMFETRVVENPALINTGALGPCVGMIIYNVRTKAALITHMVMGWELEDPIKQAGIEMPPIEDHEVYVGGASTYGRVSETQKAFMKKSREAAVKLLEDAGYKPEQLRIRFNDRHECMSLSIYTEDGEVIRHEW